jgi:hypothetical protein
VLSLARPGGPPAYDREPAIAGIWPPRSASNLDAWALTGDRPALRRALLAVLCQLEGDR